MFENVIFNSLIIVLPLFVVLLMATRGDNNYIFQMIVLIISVGLAVYFLSGCKGKKNFPQPEKTDEEYRKEAQQLFDQGMRLAAKRSCVTAIEKFERASEVYSYSDIAKKSSIMEMYCN